MYVSIHKVKRSDMCAISQLSNVTHSLNAYWLTKKKRGWLSVTVSIGEEPVTFYSEDLELEELKMIVREENLHMIEE